MKMPKIKMLNVNISRMIISKKAQEGMFWYIIAAIFAMVLIVIGFIIITKSKSGNMSILAGLKEMI